MADLIQGLKSETGLETEQVEGGLGAVFDFLKGQLPPELFARIQDAVPQAEAMIQALQSRVSEGTEGGGGGGVLGSVAELAGKIFGGKAGELPDLISSLGKAGFTLEQAKEFLPKAIAMVRQILPDDLYEKIMAQLPALAEIVMGQAGKEPS